MSETQPDFLENYLIKTLTEGPKSIEELKEATNFDMKFVAFGLNRLQHSGIVTERYEILKKPDENSIGSAAMKYELTPLWKDIYSAANSNSK